MNKDLSTYSHIMKVALPIMLSGLGHVAIIVADTIFLGQLGEVPLGAAGNGGLLFFIFVMIGMGFSTGTQIIIGRRNGEGNYKEIGNIINQAFYFIICLAFCFFLFLKFGSLSLLNQIAQSENIIAGANEYLQMRSWGIFFSVTNALFLAFFVGTTNTFVLSFSILFMALINIFLDYCLIFGNLGFPEMGIEGAALASSIAEACTTLLYIIYTLLAVRLTTYNMFRYHQPNIKMIKRILNVGGPVMLQNFISMSAWFIFFTIIEHIGERELYISHIARSAYMAFMMPTFGISSAANTLTSNLIGQGSADKVITMAKRATFLSIGSCLILVPIYILVAPAIIGIYTTDATLVNDALPTFYVIGGAMFGFAIAWVLFNIVTGTGNTKLALLLEFVDIVIYLSFAFTIVKLFDATVEIAWCSEFVYFGLLAAMSFLYLRTGRWKSVQV